MATLNELMSAARELMKDVATGPTHAAFVVEKIENDWQQLKVESEEKKFVRAMTKAFGRKRGAQFFADRRRAVDVLGLGAKRMLHHDVAVWASRKIPSEHRARFMEAVAAEYVGNYKHPLTGSAARRVALRAGIIVACERRECPRCVLLEEELKRLGYEYGAKHAAE